MPWWGGFRHASFGFDEEVQLAKVHEQEQENPSGRCTFSTIARMNSRQSLDSILVRTVFFSGSKFIATWRAEESSLKI